MICIQQDNELLYRKKFFPFMKVCGSAYSPALSGFLVLMFPKAVLTVTWVT